MVSHSQRSSDRTELKRLQNNFMQIYFAIKEKKKKEKINKGHQHRPKRKSIYVSWIFWKHFCFHEVELELAGNPLYFKSLHIVPFFYKRTEISMFYLNFIISYSPIQTANIKGKYYINIFTLFSSLQTWVSPKCLTSSF